MSQLFVYHSSQPKQAIKLLNHLEDISSTLAQVGVRLEHWQPRQTLSADSSAAEIIAAYADDIARLKQEGGYAVVDVLSIDEAHPEKDKLQAQCLAEHTHSEDEVRFFVSGRGLVNLHIDEYVYAVLCDKGTLITVPAGTKHWFDMGERPRFTALRLFNHVEGWAAAFTGAAIAQQYLTLDDLI